ncbi:hypothetical protein E6O75_ATG03906 [Venturia nashicola]|uniref:Uncharacterized protein n=1 Tax=Venturia nashicola TaxID=86259 RepID=A0A4Z1PA23_9PEZI|nr:hypothetical protein E6O75_ATG03906 [Venturia nashicola]
MCKWASGRLGLQQSSAHCVDNYQSPSAGAFKAILQINARAAGWIHNRGYRGIHHAILSDRIRSARVGCYMPVCICIFLAIVQLTFIGQTSNPSSGHWTRLGSPGFFCTLSVPLLYHSVFDEAL